jgi:PAS domain S-box-containing protein
MGQLDRSTHRVDQKNSHAPTTARNLPTLQEVSAPMDMPRSRALVLLVEDSATQSQRSAQALEAAGFRVRLATNGRDALDQARRWRPNVIVSDVLMPIMDGFALCREVRRDDDLGQIPLVLHTMTFVDPRDEEFGLGLGATRFVLKSADPADLVAEVRSVLDAGHVSDLPAVVDDRGFLTGYSERLAAKLEDKVAELEQAYRLLEQQSQEKLRLAQAEIQQRTHAEGLIRQSEARKAAILETALDAIITIDQDGQILEFNAAAERAFGHTRQAVFGRELTQTLIPSRLQAQYRDGLMRDLVAGDARVLNRHIFLTAQRADQSEFPVEVTIARMPTVGPTLFTAFMRDITDRLQSEATQRHLAAIVDSSNDAIIGNTLDGIVTSWNAGAERLYGYSAQDIVGQPISLLTPAGRADELATMFAGLQEERIEQYETLRLTKDGRLLDVSLSISPLHDGDGRIVGAATTAQDISGRKQAEAQIQALNTDLERRVVERTAELESAITELDAFSYSVSHDLRRPLRAVNGFTSILMQRHASALTPEGRGLLQRVLNSAQNMGQLIDDLLAFSRLGRQSLQKRPVLPTVVARSALAELAQELDGRAVEVMIGELPACEADPALLRQVYINLLSNALKFTRQANDPLIHVGSRQTGDGVEYFVKDNGAGFDMRYVHKLFGVFQRLHRAEDYEGTGVGLALVQRIVHRHGGRIWADAAPDKGATFFFTLEGPTEASGSPSEHPSEQLLLPAKHDDGDRAA